MSLNEILIVLSLLSIAVAVLVLYKYRRLCNRRIRVMIKDRVIYIVRISDVDDVNLFYGARVYADYLDIRISPQRKSP